MKTILRLMFLLVAAGFSQRASAQQFTNYFSAYESYAVDSGHIYKSVTISGYTVVSGAGGDMQFIAIHTPHVTNTVGSTTQVNQGQGMCATCQINYTSPTLTKAFVDGEEDGDSTTATMVCSIKGVFFTWFMGQYLEEAYTQSVFSGAKTNCTTSSKTGITYCDYIVAPACTPSTSPPDLNPTAVEGSSLFLDPNYYDINGIGFRFTTSSRFIFLNVDTYAVEVYGSRLLAYCTKNDPF